MPKKTYADENIPAHDHCQRNFLLEPITQHIMKEMDVIPFGTTSLIGDNYVVSNAKRPLQVVNGTKKRMLIMPERKSFKACMDDYVLFQNIPNFLPPGEDYFNRLSDEIILQIFQWLPKSTLARCAEVCKRWKNLSCDESLWTRYDFGRKFVQPGALGVLLQRGVSVLRLAMAEVKAPVFLDYKFISRQRFSKLQYLDLSMTTISPDSVANLLAVCNRLKKLSLEACSLNEDCCKYIAQNKALEVLNMSMCKGLTDAGLTAIFTNCARLKELNLAWVQINSSSMDSLSFLPQALIRLNLSGHRTTMNDRALFCIIKQCPNLIELDISDCHLLTQLSFMPLIQTCTRLEHLHTSRTYSIPTECYRHLRSLKNFKKLEIFRTLMDDSLLRLREFLYGIKVNSEPFSTIARPTTGMRRTSIWGLRVRD